MTWTPPDTADTADTAAPISTKCIKTLLPDPLCDPRLRVSLQHPSQVLTPAHLILTQSHQQWPPHYLVSARHLTLKSSPGRCRTRSHLRRGPSRVRRRVSSIQKHSALSCNVPSSGRRLIVRTKDEMVRWHAQGIKDSTTGMASSWGRQPESGCIPALALSPSARLRRLTVSPEACAAGARLSRDAGMGRR